MDREGLGLYFETVDVDGVEVTYGAGGIGPTLLFLHGWALGHHTNALALTRLIESGFSVVAPDLPGFGSSGDVAEGLDTFEGYADWLKRFCEVVGTPEQMTVVGHSFGGGVAIALAHRHPKLVHSLVLVNSVGGATWSTRRGKLRSMAERPLWDWGLHFPAELATSRQIRRVLPVIARDAVGNMVRNPRALVRVARLASRADLTAELQELRERELPVVVLWGKEDRILPMESFDALCKAVGAEPTVVEGSHGWLFADPDQFAEVLTNVAPVAKLAAELDPEGDEEVVELDDL